MKIITSFFNRLKFFIVLRFAINISIFSQKFFVKQNFAIIISKRNFFVNFFLVDDLSKFVVVKTLVVIESFVVVNFFEIFIMLTILKSRKSFSNNIFFVNSIFVSFIDIIVVKNLISFVNQSFIDFTSIMTWRKFFANIFFLVNSIESKVLIRRFARLQKK